MELYESYIQESGINFDFRYDYKITKPIFVLIKNDEMAIHRFTCVLLICRNIKNFSPVKNSPESLAIFNNNNEVGQNSFQKLFSLHLLYLTEMTFPFILKYSYFYAIDLNFFFKS
jgi:hypothetical protein